MTQNEFIKQISDELTISGSLPTILNEAEIRRIIEQARKMFNDDYQYAVQKQHFVLEAHSFNNPQFRNSKQIVMPDCVISVVKFQEINGVGRLGNIDSDFAENRLIASEIFVSSFHGDDLITRLANYSYFDISRAMFLEQIQYDFNKNTKILRVTGRTPRFDVYVDTWSYISDDKMYDDYLFLRWCTCQAKLSFARLIGLYPFTLPGGIQINGDLLKSEADTEMEQIKTQMKENDCADWIETFH